MKIGRIIYEREKYADLLRIGDEQDDMIARYLERGDMYVGFVNGRPVGVCVVTAEGPELMEVKNLAVYPECRRKGYGRSLLEFVENGMRIARFSSARARRLPCCGFMSGAVIVIRIGFPTFLPIITTIPSWKRACCSGICFISRNDSQCTSSGGYPSECRRVLGAFGCGVRVLRALKIRLCL